MTTATTNVTFCLLLSASFEENKPQRTVALRTW